MRNLIILIILLSTYSVEAQNRHSIAFYNVESLYDTLPSPFYDDTDYTPNGRLRWNAERYRSKIENICKVIDTLQSDVVVLAEVENEEVVRDLVVGMCTDYNYIHRNTRDHRGMDIALLYKGDKFTPRKVRQINSGTTRQFLYVQGELDGEQLDLLCCHLPSQFSVRESYERSVRKLSSFADSLSRMDTASRVVIV